VWRVVVAGLGLVVVIAGIVMLIIPGPGWVTIFIGFAIWSTEFPWAQSVLAFVRRQLARCTSWIRDLPRWLLWVAVGIVCLLLVAAVAWVAVATSRSALSRTPSANTTSSAVNENAGYATRLGLNCFQFPSETTSTVPLTTLMAVCSSMA